MQDFTTSI